ncbi:MAG TPA: flavin reductase family protein [Candidatus Solibacter sp.]|nr:flavin reductase family protein [Candidatus Solibacter sp.]
MITEDLSLPTTCPESKQPFHPREYRNALGRFATGVSVVTTHHHGRTHGMTANAFVSVSLDPPLVLLSLDNRSQMHQILPATGVFGVSVLAEGQEAISNHFAGRAVDGLEIQFVTRRNVPVLEGAVAYFVARVVNTHEAGDHTLYIGHVEHFESSDGRPLLFFAGDYEQIRRRKTSRRRQNSAPARHAASKT